MASLWMVVRAKTTPAARLHRRNLWHLLPLLLGVILYLPFLILPVALQLAEAGVIDLGRPATDYLEDTETAGIASVATAPLADWPCAPAFPITPRLWTRTATGFWTRCC